MPSDTAPYIPAWKRIGLKLKNGTDVVDQQKAETKSNKDNALGSKRQRDDQSQGKNSKRPRTDLVPTDAGRLTKRNDSMSVKPGRAKPGTNAETSDGDTLHQSDASIAQAATAASTSSKSPKKDPKPQKSRPQPSNPTSTTHRPAYLDYLEQFHTARPSWKFNKAKQNDLVKNIWNTYRVPPTYNAALQAYIAGLQGQSLQSRLEEQCTSTIKEMQTELDSTTADMSTHEARTAVFQQALERDEPQDEPKARELFAHRLARSERVAVVQRGLRQAQPRLPAHPPPPRPLSAPSTGRHVVFDDDEPEESTKKPVSAKRKRKSRTAGDISSDSESSSSSSSSEDDSDESSQSSHESSSDHDTARVTKRKS